MSSPEQEAVPPGAPFIPSGPVPYVNVPNTADYPRLVFSAPRFETVAIADIIQPSVNEACEAILPTLVPPYVNSAANAAVQNLAVQLVGSTMSGPLMLSPPNPTQPTMAATKQYVDTMVATVVPEVPPVPANQAWARETGQWIPLAGGGTVTNIATGAGLTGGPITATGTVAMANMAANSLKGNNTGAVAAPTDIAAGNVLTMIGGAPLNSPNFTGSPSLPTGTAAITQPGGTNNTTVATTAFVAGAITTATGNYLPLTGGRLSGGLASGPAATTVPGLGALTLNANTVAGPASVYAPTSLRVVGADNAAPAAVVEAYGTNLPIIAGQLARGTAASPAALTLNSIMLRLQAVGYNGSAFGSATYIDFLASQAWTGTSQGSELIFYTTPNGTTTPVGSLVLQGNTAQVNGQLTVSQTTGISTPGALVVTSGFNSTDDSGGQITMQHFTIPGNKKSLRVTHTNDFQVINAGYTTPLLDIQDNGFITISGPLSIPINTSLYLNGAGGGAPGRIYCDANNLNLVVPGTGAFQFANTAGTVTASINNTGSATFSSTVAATGSMTINPTAAPQSQVIMGGLHTWYALSDNSGQWSMVDQSTSAYRMIITGTGACSASSAWTVISDASLKTDIEDHPHGLAEILQLQPKRFRIVADDRIATGLIAQDLEAVMPELVGEMATLNGDPVKTVTETGILWPLVNAVKEINARLTALERRA